MRRIKSRSTSRLAPLADRVRAVAELPDTPPRVRAWALALVRGNTRTTTAPTKAKG